MRSVSVRDLESTPGQLYCRRSEPEMISTRKGRSEVGSLPFSSFGFISPPVIAGGAKKERMEFGGGPFEILAPAGRKFNFMVCARRYVRRRNKSLTFIGPGVTLPTVR